MTKEFDCIFLQSYVSLKRLNKFLNSEELDARMIEHNTGESE